MVRLTKGIYTIKENDIYVDKGIGSKLVLAPEEEERLVKLGCAEYVSDSVSTTAPKIRKRGKKNGF